MSRCLDTAAPKCRLAYFFIVNLRNLRSEGAWKWRVEKASPFSTLRNVDA